jgi:hypothetical protein
LSTDTDCTHVVQVQRRACLGRQTDSGLKR